MGIPDSTTTQGAWRWGRCTPLRGRLEGEGRRDQHYMLYVHTPERKRPKKKTLLSWGKNTYPHHNLGSHGFFFSCFFFLICGFFLFFFLLQKRREVTENGVQGEIPSTGTQRKALLDTGWHVSSSSFRAPELQNPFFYFINILFIAPILVSYFLYELTLFSSPSPSWIKDRG